MAQILSAFFSIVSLILVFFLVPGMAYDERNKARRRYDMGGNGRLDKLGIYVTYA